jgi:hypothetical protein
MHESESQGSAFLQGALLGVLAKLPATQPTPPPAWLLLLVEPEAIQQPEQPVATSDLLYHPALPPPSPSATPFYTPRPPRPVGLSTGFYNNPPYIAVWQVALFEIQELLIIAPEQYKAYWPYIDNAWVLNRNSRKAVTIGTTTSYW